MANQANIMKLMAALGGGASEGYGSFVRKGGQPILPKPGISAPDLMSPYAPGNLGGRTVSGNYHSAGPSQVEPQNSTVGVKHSEMRESAPHPAAQLAQYLTTSGASPSPRLKKNGMDPGAFIRGGRFVDSDI